MYEPAANDEITGVVRYLDEQLTAIRAAAIGLTDEQVRMRPCTSALSVGGLIKHVTQGMTGAIARLRGSAPTAYDEAALAAYMAGFTLGPDETALDVLAAFDAARVDYLEAVAAADPDSPTVEPPQPWFGIFDARPANTRYYLVHQIEEMARHAGHADIIREQIDGVSIPQIVLSQDGMPANDYFEVYAPAPGTIGGPPA